MQWLKKILKIEKDLGLCAYKFIAKRPYSEVDLKLVTMHWPNGENRFVKVKKISPNTKNVIIGMGDLITVAVPKLMGKNACGKTPMAVFKIGDKSQYYIIPSNVMDAIRAESGS